MSSQTLYRFWNADSELLYVGISVRPWDRWRQHRGDKPWWEEVAQVTLENFATRAEVQAAELAAIRAEAPHFNIAGRADMDPQQPCGGADDWDGIHKPLIACIDDLVYCSCDIPDWESDPDLPRQGDDLDAYYAATKAWRESQKFYKPGEYSAHVIAAVLGDTFPTSGS